MQRIKTTRLKCTVLYLWFGISPCRKNHLVVLLFWINYTYIVMKWNWEDIGFAASNFGKTFKRIIESIYLTSFVLQKYLSKKGTLKEAKIQYLENIWGGIVTIFNMKRKLELSISLPFNKFALNLPSNSEPVERASFSIKSTSCHLPIPSMMVLSSTNKNPLKCQ